MKSLELDGELLTPTDDGYDKARTVWNAMVDNRPRFIARCTSVADVITSVRTARELDLGIGVHCGGHSVVGHAVPDDGFMIDLSPFGGVTVDPERKRAVVQGGALLGALDAASQPFGLATTAGNVSHTGVGGLTLGGGMGWLARQYGLSCDNVLSLEVVTADGEVLRASETEEPDLFWALRGGGGNFGIVTSFEFQLHETGTEALIAEFSYPVDKVAPVVRDWRDLNATAPRAATFTLTVSGDTALVGFVWVGDPAAAQPLLGQFRSLGQASRERVDELSYLDLQRIDDTVDGHARRRYWKGHYFYELPDQAIDLLLGRGSDTVHDYLPNCSLQAYGGAIAEVADEATAFSHRKTKFEYVCATGWTDPAEDNVRIAGARAAAAAVEPFTSGSYVNALNDEGAIGVGRAYSASQLTRLTQVKDRFDPSNVFRLNHNIKPSGQ